MAVSTKLAQIQEKTKTAILQNYTLHSTYETHLQIPPNKTGIALTLKSQYHPSSLSGINIYIYYSQDGVNYDTDTDEIYSLPHQAGQVKQKTFIIPAVTNFIKIKIENTDTNPAIIDIHITLF